MESTPLPTLTTPPDLPYRPCVGIMLLNADGKVWVGRRLPKWAGDKAAHIWQMPQGGIEKFEPPRLAALRELQEETAVTKVEILAEYPDWLTYDLPDDLLGIALKGKYRGQRQRWFAMRFLGTDDDIDISARDGRKAEFDAWRWVSIEELPDLIISFKRGIYETIVRDFARFANADVVGSQE